MHTHVVYKGLCGVTAVWEVAMRRMPFRVKLTPHKFTTSFLSQPNAFNELIDKSSGSEGNQQRHAGHRSERGRWGATCEVFQKTQAERPDVPRCLPDICRAKCLE